MSAEAAKVDPTHEGQEAEKKKVLSKRDNYLEWNDYFMAIAFLSAQRSKDPRTQLQPEKRMKYGIRSQVFPLIDNVRITHDDMETLLKETDSITV